MKKLKIQLKNTTYAIWIEKGLLFRLSTYIQKVYQNKNIYIITDDIVEKIYLDIVKKSLSGYHVKHIIVPHGESSKNMNVYSEVIQKLLEQGMRRNELLLALGGGVIGDLTGFIASTIYRGVPYISIPTSLLSQLDSSIGGKTGIDFNECKNIIGTFYQPKLVLIDPQTLDTLPKEEYYNGMGELIKHAVIGNLLLEQFKNHVQVDEQMIYQSLCVKKNIVEKDEFDLKERLFLNFGHTFGHVIELEKKLRHGEAVALGMLMALRLGIDLGITKQHCYTQIQEILQTSNLPYQEPSYQKYLKDIVKDKKNFAGCIQFVMLKDIGKPILYPILEEKIKELIK